MRTRIDTGIGKGRYTMSGIKKFLPLLLVVAMLCTFIAGCDNSENKVNWSDMDEAVNFVDVKEDADTLFVTVQKGETGCVFYAYEKKNNGWSRIFDCEGYLGYSGVCKASEKREGDGHSPDGLYSMGECFGVNEAPCDVPAGYTVVTEDDYWDCDSSSDTYNLHVKGSEKSAEWLDAGNYEHLIEYKICYAYAAMINYNVDPVVPGRGSAIFLHCTDPDDTSSAGCISIPEERMKEALGYITENSYILILAEASDIENYAK